MPRQFYGISSLTRGVEFSPQNKSSDNVNIVSVRVKDIILDDSHPKFKEYGEWNGVGTIFYDNVNFPFATNTANIATPLFSNQKFFPLINEVVSLLFLTSTSTQTNTNITSAYYLPPTNIWNSQHHNALPDPTQEPKSNSTQDYENAENGVSQNVRRVGDNSTEIDLGDDFNEKINTHPLLSFIGDHILEGRWGNSIRLGSTIKNNLNIWSNNGENGDPITIIRNGQANNINKDSWVPISEDINNDQSSIYLTSNQKLPIEVSSNDYSSYTTAPIAPSEYINNQIVLNSGRLLLNSKDNEILFSAKTTINLNSPTSVNIDTKDFIISTNKIYLGNKQATEPLLKGDVTVTQLNLLIDALVQFFTIYGSEPPNLKVGSTPLASASIIPTLNNVKATLSRSGVGGAKSSNNFTT